MAVPKTGDRRRRNRKVKPPGVGSAVADAVLTSHVAGCERQGAEGRRNSTGAWDEASEDGGDDKQAVKQTLSNGSESGEADPNRRRSLLDKWFR
jgi:hypothetical protein